MLNDDLFSVLTIIYDRLSSTAINWAVTGSASFALQGLPFDPTDIDIQTDESGAYQIERLFKEYIEKDIKYSSNGLIRSHFGELIISGIRVEIMGDIDKLINHEWVKQPNLDDIKEFVLVDNMRIPVLSLNYEAKAYRALGRTEKADRITQYVKNR